jgi:hypothetical protein
LKPHPVMDGAFYIKVVLEFYLMFAYLQIKSLLEISGMIPTSGNMKNVIKFAISNINGIE